MKKNQIITFSEANHSYFLEKERLESVNGVLKLYGFEFDSDYWSVHKAIEANVADFYKLFFRKFNFEDRMPTQEQLIDYFSHLLGDICLGEEVCKVEDEWEESRTNGTLFHAYRETEAHERGFIVNPFTGEKFITQPVPKIPEGFANASHENMSKLKDGAHTELLIPSINHMIAGQADEVFIETIDKIRYVDIGDHKGLEINTPILTTKGWFYMKDLKVGDIVFDKNGNHTKITAVSKIHHNPCYNVTFDTNDNLIADDEHKWVVSIRNRSGVYVEQELTTQDIHKYYEKRENAKYSNGFHKYKKLSIKINNPIDFENIDLPIDPYVLGMWLADGNRTCGTISCNTPDIWNEIKRRGYEISDDHNRHNNKNESRTVYGLISKLKSLNLIKNKHIPDIYYTSSKSQRIDLIRGFLDGDGSYNKKRKRVVMQTTSSLQAKYLSSMLSTLGVKSTTIKYSVNGFLKKDGYSVSFKSEFNPFLVRNVDCDIEMNSVKNKKPSQYRYIDSVVSIESVPTICIAVDSPTKTYLAGENLIATHNTNNKLPKLEGTKTLTYPLDHLIDCTYTKYQLQVSLYAYMMELHGYVPRTLGFYHYKNYDVSTKKVVTFKYLREECKQILDLHLALS